MAGLAVDMIVNGTTVPVVLALDKAYTKTGQKGPYTVLPAQVYGTLSDGTSFRASFAFILKTHKANGKGNGKAAKASAPAPAVVSPPARKGADIDAAMSALLGR